MTERMQPVRLVTREETQRILSRKWVSEASCLGLDTNDFFPARGESCSAADVCQECPVREPCLLYAIINRDECGIWGGTTALVRRHLRRKFVIEGAACAACGKTLEPPRVIYCSDGCAGIAKAHRRLVSSQAV